MSLSEKRNELFTDNLTLCTTEEEKLLLNNAFVWIEKQDKEFIKELKEKFPEGYSWNRFAIIKVIDKLAGEDLI